MLLHTFSPSPIVFALGPLFLRWYGLLLGIGAALAFWITFRLARRQNIPENDVLNLGALAVLIGFLGARFYHVLNEPSYYWHHPAEILQVWHGGLAIHGGLLTGLITILVYCRRKGLHLWAITDLIAPGLVLAQAIGRWGNYFNQELFGRPTNLPWGIPIDPAYRPANESTSTYFHPTFLYESLWNVGVFVLLFALARRTENRRLPDGVVTMLYLGLYSLGRFGTELLRIDDVPIIAGLRLPLLVSGALVLAALAGLWFFVRRRRQNQSLRV